MNYVLSRGVALLFGVVLIFLTVCGCGGEVGGSPSGIAGALTKGSTIRVSSFALTTSNAVNDLADLAQDGTTERNPSQVVPNIAGALYPTRNSESFRLVLKGAGSDLEDVAFYFDIYAGPPPGASGELKVGSTVLSQFYVHLTGSGAVRALRQGSVYTDTVTGKEAPASEVFAVKNAYTYANPDDSRSVRTGVRNVVVQFFSKPASQVKDKYENELPGLSGAQAAAAESAFQGQNLTNAYVFSANIQAGKPQIDLTAGYQTDNGSNGLIDTGSFNVGVPAANQPTKWESVRFQVFEESADLNGEGFSYSRVVNRPSSSLPAQLPDFETLKDDPTFKGIGTTIQFANRQRVLKAYATFYSKANGGGSVVAQTWDSPAIARSYRNDDVANRLYNTAGYPVLFLPNALAQLDKVFDPLGRRKETLDSATTSLLGLAVKRSVVLKGAQVPQAVDVDAPQTVKVVGDYIVQPRFAFGSLPTAEVRRSLAPDQLDLFSFSSIDRDGLPSGFELPEGTYEKLASRINADGRIEFGDGDQDESNDVHFDQTEGKVYSLFRLTYDIHEPGSGPVVNDLYFYAYVSPDRGTGSGGVRGGRRP